MKTIKLSAIMVFMLMLSIAFSACGGDSSDGSKETNVYAGGYCEDSSGDYHACYWKNGSIVELDKDNESEVFAVALSGSEIYAVGRSNGVAGYWKNNTWTELENEEGGSSSKAVCIFINGSDIYIGGDCNNGSNSVAGYWKNDEWEQLIDITQDSFVKSIFTDGGDVYAGGYYYDSSATPICIPCYWKNGTKVDLPNDLSSSHAYAFSIAVYGNNVYTGGYCKDSTDTSIAGYWTNTTWTGFTNYEEAGIRTSISSLIINDGNIYAGGYSDTSDEMIAGYWTDNGTDITWTALANEYDEDIAQVNSLYIDGNDIYAGGESENASNYYVGGYWKNGTWVECSNTYGEYDAGVNSIVVVKE